MIYDICPVPKPRMTQSDKWKKRPPVMRYRAFADEVKLKGVEFLNGQSIIFRIPIAKSVSNKIRAEVDGQAHTKKPDLSNLLKALEDAMYQDDSWINNISGLKKFWVDGDGTIEIFWPDERSELATC